MQDQHDHPYPLVFVRLIHLILLLGIVAVLAFFGGRRVEWRDSTVVAILVAVRVAEEGKVGGRSGGLCR